MVSMKFHHAILSAGIIIFSCALFPALSAEGAPWTGNATLTGRLIVESNVANAEVYCDSALIGTVPLTKDGIAPGLHEVAVMKNGYVREVRRIRIIAGEETSIRIELRPINGIIEVTGVPDKTSFEVTVGDKKQQKKTIEVTEGSYAVTVRVFGYKDRAETVAVKLDQTIEVQGALEAAPFAATALAPSKTAFNPLNPAKLGTMKFSFLVTGPGTGSLEIRDATGTTVRTIAAGPFATWKQTIVWDGRNEAGRALGDGRYVATLRATGEDGTESAPLETAVVIDRNIAFPLTGSDSGIGSTGPVVSASLMPAKGVLFGFEGYGGKKEFGSGATIQAGFADFLEGGAHVSAGIGSGAETAIDFAGGLKAGKKLGNLNEAVALVWKTRSGTIPDSSPAFRNGLSLGPAVEYRLGACTVGAFPCATFGNVNGALANGWGTVSLGTAIRFTPGDFSLAAWANADSGKLAGSFKPVADWSAGLATQIMIPSTNLFLSAEAAWIKKDSMDGSLFAKGGFGIRF